MLPLTVVIITRNEARNIADCIRSARQLTSDIVVVDCGSTDDTCGLARENGARVKPVRWRSFGHSRNAGAAAARHDWIFALDADERITEELARAINDLSLPDTDTVYRVRRRNFLAGTPLRFGTAGHDRPTRLYNRQNARWDLSLVHEQLVCKQAKLQNIGGGHLLHDTARTAPAFREKLEQYALLCARKYQGQHRKASFTKRRLAPLFDAFKSFVLQLGFLDGCNGLAMARLIHFYTHRKYGLLRQLEQRPGAARLPVSVELLDPSSVG